MIYDAACYPAGTGTCHDIVGLLQQYDQNHFTQKKQQHRFTCSSFLLLLKNEVLQT